METHIKEGVSPNPNAGIPEFQDGHGIAADVVLQKGNVYVGRVYGSYIKSGILNVYIGRNPVEGCQYAPGITASMLGVTDYCFPSIGSQVLVLYGSSQSYVIGTIPQQNRPMKGGFFGSIGGDPYDMAYTYKSYCSPNAQGVIQAAQGMRPSSDLLPGERETTSSTGSFLRLLIGMTQLGSGDLAMVETSLHNDMVRIIDNYFVHHSCGGDEYIWTNGFCNKQSFFTSYQYEADSMKLEENKPYAQTHNKVPTTESIEDEFNETGRWRVQTMYGHIADLIHIMVNDPVDAISHFDKKDQKLGGKARMWVGANGMVMVQSCAAIHIEVTPKIIIPHQKYSWNHPEMKDVDSQKAEPDGEYLDLWGSGPDWKDLSVACWQLQSYMKYLSLWLSLGHFKQWRDKHDMFSIPTEEEAKEPRPDCDDQRPGGKEGYKNAYGAITIDGSGTVTVCGWGTTTLTLNQGNIHADCPGDFRVKAGGTISLVGTNVAVSATKRMELSSLGGMWLRARNWFYALCEKGRMWLKSDAAYEEDASENAELKDIDKPAKGHFGVVIDSAASGVLVNGTTGAVVSVKNGRLDAKDPECGKLTLQNEKGDVNIYAGNHIFATAKQKIWEKCESVISEAKQYFANFNFFRVNENFAILGSVLAHKGITVLGNILAKSISTVPGSVPGKYKQSHLDDDYKNVLEGASAQQGQKDYDYLKSKTTAEFTYDVDNDELGHYKWRFCSWGLNKGEADSFKSLKVPLHELNAVKKRVKDLHKITLSSIKLSDFAPTKANRTSDSYPSWPGTGAKEWSYSMTDSLKPLGEAWDEEYTAEHIGGLSKMEEKAYTFYESKERKG